MTSEHVTEMLRIVKPLFARHGFDFYAALLVQSPRSMVVLTSIFFRKGDAAETSRAKRLYDDLVEATARTGFQQYRAGVSGMQPMAASAPAFVEIVRTLKGAVDPKKGVLAPGKCGV